MSFRDGQSSGGLLDLGVNEAILAMRDYAEAENGDYPFVRGLQILEGRIVKVVRKSPFNYLRVFAFMATAKLIPVVFAIYAKLLIEARDRGSPLLN